MRLFFWALREAFSSKGKALARVISLALGLSIGLVLFSYNSYQLTYDNFQKQGDRIYRVSFLGRMNGEKYEGEKTYAPLAEAMKQDFPEVEAAACVKLNWEKEGFRYGENEFRELTLYADTAFFRFFSYPLVVGDQDALINKNNIFISERVAEKIFGTEPAVGKQIWSGGKEWVVAGIFADLPKNTHLFFDVVKSLDALSSYKGWKGGDSYYSYVRLVDPAAVDKIEGQSRQFLGKYIDLEETEFGLHLQPLRKLYLLYSGGGVVARIVILSLLALVMLFVSGVNYVLLSISSIGRKAKLMGIHKVNGATGKDLFRMFMTETGILLGLAFLLAVTIILFSRPWTERELYISLVDLLTWQNLGMVLLVLAAMFLFSGFFPARLLSSMSFRQIERQVVVGSRKWKTFLLSGQFMMVAFLLVLLWIVVGQTGILLNQDPGYAIERLYFAKVLDNSEAAPAFQLKEELRKLPCVEEVTVAEGLPVEGLPGIRVKNKVTDEEVVSARWLVVDEDFFKVMHIPVSWEEGIWKSGAGVIVNKKLLELLHRPENLGDYIAAEGGYVPVGGICRDFQLGSFYNEQMPLMVSRILRDRYYGTLNVVFRLTVATPENITAVKKVLANTSGKQLPELMNYVDYMQGDYSSLFQLRRLVMGMAGIVLVIIILGLIGYTSDEVNRRTKEIAIRKVNGAETYEVIGLLLLKLSWTAIGGIPLGLALAYWMGHQVLEGFVIKYPMSWWIFAGTVLFIFVVMTVVVYTCAYKAAATNPVKSLKSE